MTIDIKMLEKVMKLMKKNQISHIMLPDGTQIVAALQSPQLLMPKPLKQSTPVNDPQENVDIRFAAVLPKQQTDFSRFRVSNLLKNKVE